MKYPWMPLFLGDLLADTLHLSAQEFGAYMLLILHAWKHDGKIPVNKAIQIARVHPPHWAKVRSVLAPFFKSSLVTDFVTLKVTEIWTHERVTKELTNAGELSNKRKGAAEQMHSKRRANAYAHAQNLDASASHPPSQSLKDFSNGKGREAPTVQVHVNWRDKGVEYRAPPRTKSNNVLEPLPLLAAKGKDKV